LLMSMAAPPGWSQAVEPSGDPGLTGIWALIGPGIDPALQPRVYPPAKFKGPYAEQFAAMRAARHTVAGLGRVETELERSLAHQENDCRPYGMPSVMWGGYTMDIIQQPDKIVIVNEAILEVRRIYLDRPQLPIEEVPPSYGGRSVGHWEGTTLVVDTVGVRTDVVWSYDGDHDLPHSDQVHMTERIHRVAPDVVQNLITIEDPLALEEPYQFAYALERQPKTYETPEYICDNRRVGVDENGRDTIVTKRGH
jgi:hypothetical protein